MRKLVPFAGTFLHTFLALTLVVLALGCTGNTTSDATQTDISGDDTMASNKFAVIETNKGTIKLELFEDKAPTTTANFIKLAESGFYNGLAFHRYVAGFVIQGGDPKGDGTGGSAESIPLEIHPDLRHIQGALAMARAQDPNSASSQFYITLEASHSLDDNYAVFGQVVEGLDVALALRQGDKMVSVEIVANQ